MAGWSAKTEQPTRCLFCCLTANREEPLSLPRELPALFFPNSISHLSSRSSFLSLSFLCLLLPPPPPPCRFSMSESESELFLGVKNQQVQQPPAPKKLMPIQ